MGDEEAWDEYDGDMFEADGIPTVCAAPKPGLEADTHCKHWFATRLPCCWCADDDVDVDGAPPCPAVSS